MPTAPSHDQIRRTDGDSDPGAPTAPPHQIAPPSPPDASDGAAPRAEASRTFDGLRTRWIQRTVHAHATAPNRADLLDRLLAARGLTESADRVLNPSLLHLHDPAELHGLPEAGRRLTRAARDGEPIVVFGDYDADGITATAILVRALRAAHPAADVRWYIPHRLDEGYGLSCDALRDLAGRGGRVVVSVDCGVTAARPARTARELGLDLIITDHHEGPVDPRDWPDAYAIVHPRHPEGASPFGQLCGAGVAWKLAWALLVEAAGRERLPPDLRSLLIDLMGLAALGTIADLVPLLDENRVIARYGLGRLTHSPFVGLRALIEAANLSGDAIDAERVGFALAPRLNAAGRLDHARSAVELLLTDDAARATHIAAELCRLNDQRRATERGIVELAERLAEDHGMTGPERRAIVLAHESWHPGVVGIVCSRLVERFGRPTILMQRRGEGDDAVCVGSGRSIDGFNLHAALGDCAGHLERFGGHEMAAGLRLDAAHLDAFTEAFCDRVGAALSPENAVPRTAYDLDAAPHELTTHAVARLHELAPFGRGNPAPRFRVAADRLRDPTPMGKRGDHLSFRVESSSPGPCALRVVMWRRAELLDRLRPGARVEVLAEPRLNTFNGRTTVELDALDLRHPAP